MISFRDRTFCANPECTCHPDRKLTEEVKAAAIKWWGGPDAPISVGNLCGGKKREDSN